MIKSCIIICASGSFATSSPIASKLLYISFTSSSDIVECFWRSERLCTLLIFSLTLSGTDWAASAILLRYIDISNWFWVLQSELAIPGWAYSIIKGAIYLSVYILSSVGVFSSSSELFIFFWEVISSDFTFFIDIFLSF